MYFIQLRIMGKCTTNHFTNDLMIMLYPDMPTQDLANELNLPIHKVYRLATKLKLKKSKEYLDNWELSGRGRMIEQGKAYRFKKGHMSWNKDKSPKDYMPAESYEKLIPTQFKKGTNPPNTKHDGAISIRSDKSGAKYKYIRLSKANWMALHVKIYQEEYGPIPKNHIIVFKDRNSLNCTLNNLECITKAENMQRNTIHRYPTELKNAIKTLSTLKKQFNGKKQNH